MEYKSIFKIDLDSGDVKITVSGDEQDFTFFSGLGSLILPQFLELLLSFTTGKNSRGRLQSYGNSDYYIFVRGSKKIRIEYVRHSPGRRDIYVFDLNKFVIAIDKAFKRLIKQLQTEGIIPIKNEELGHPLGKNVLEAYNKFSSNL